MTRRGHAGVVEPGSPLHRRLEEIALPLFDERGYDAVTVEQLAAAAGVSAMTVYRHVGSKASLVFSARDREVLRLRAAAAAGEAHPDPRVMVVCAVQRFAASLAVDREDYLLRVRIIRGSKRLLLLAATTRRAVEQALLEGLLESAGGGRAGVPLRVACAAGAGVVEVTGRQWQEGQQDWPALVTDAFRSLWPDLRP